MSEPEDASTFTLRRVQSMLGLSRTVLDGLIGAGFVAPTRGRRNAYRFSFQDLLLLRTAHALQASKIPPRRILRSLARLKASLPQALPLTGLRITAIGADVAVRQRDGLWRADSGQLLLDFDVAPAGAGQLAFIERAAVPSATIRPPADDGCAAWFACGKTLEATDPQGAEAAYLQALALAPEQPAAYLNLGAMYGESGRFAELLALTDQALRHCPPCADLALLHFNRGVALDHLERLGEAVGSYEQALALDPSLADAHYNLGRLREHMGDARGALRSFSAYRRLQRPR